MRLSVSPEVFQSPPGTERGKKQTRGFLRNSRSWEKTTGLNLRDSGPGYGHHSTAWCPCQLSSPAWVRLRARGCCHGSSSAAPCPCTANWTCLPGQALADQAFTGRAVKEPAASLTARLVPSALSSDDVEKQPSNRRAVTCLCVHTALRLQNLFWSRWKKLLLKDKRNLLLGHIIAHGWTL